MEAPLGLTRTVLIVEDEPDLRDALASALIRRGYAVVTAGNAEAADDLLGRSLPALVVTDMMLPGSSGFQVIRAVKDRPGGDRVRVVMMTGNPSPAHRDYALASGADRFLTKPFATIALVQAVMELCPPGPVAAIRSAPAALTIGRLPG
jgi:DNA-binding response OmpR family regulator